jgi:hypothetical protein
MRKGFLVAYRPNRPFSSLMTIGGRIRLPKQPERSLYFPFEAGSRAQDLSTPTGMLWQKERHGLFLRQGLVVRIGLRRDITGSLLGLMVFLGGVALLLLTFRMAYDLFTSPPTAVLGLRPDKPVDLGSAGSNLVQALFRVIALIIMALVGSLVANRGIQLYSDSRGHIHEPAKSAPEPDEISRFTSEGGKEATG